MHVIAVYDVNAKRVGKVLKIFRKYLTWIQNSVFQGDITEKKLAKLQKELYKVVDKKEDSIIFYKLRTEELIKKEFIGIETDPFNNII